MYFGVMFAVQISTQIGLVLWKLVYFFPAASIFVMTEAFYYIRRILSF